MNKHEVIVAEGQTANRERLEYIHAHKTAALIRAAVRLGGIAGGASREKLEALGRYGNSAGLAFQIANDILNATSSPAELGKPVGNDLHRKKLTAIAVYGRVAAVTRADELANHAIEELAAIAGDTEPLRVIARFVVQRSQ